METQVQGMARKQRDKWDMLGIEPVWERGTCRLPQFKKSFSPDVEVTVLNRETGQYEPYLLRSGRPLKAAEVLPERADLALDEHGRLLDQYEFEQRYEMYLDSFVMPPGFDPKCEPVPNVKAFVNRKPDIWTESRGMVEIDFDPGIGTEFKPKVLWDGEKEITVEEFKRQEAELDAAKNEKADKLERLLIALGEKVLGEEATEVPVEQKMVEPEKIGVAPEREKAMCGKWVKAGYKAQHERFCKDPLCGGGDEAA